MKKILLILFVLAICVLAFPQGVMAAPQEIPVNAIVEPITGFTVDGGTDLWTLYYAPPNGPTNTHPDPLYFVVTSNVPWDVSVIDNDPATQGHLTAYNDATNDYDSSTFLTNQLEVGGVYSFGGNIIESQDTTGEIIFTEDLVQTLVAADASGPMYRIVLTFDCTPQILVP